MKLYIQVVDPTIVRKPPTRALTMRDIITVPAQNRADRFKVLDMLSDDSVRNLIQIYNTLKK